MHRTVMFATIVSSLNHSITHVSANLDHGRKKILHPKDNYMTVSSLIIDRVTRFGKKRQLG